MIRMRKSLARMAIAAMMTAAVPALAGGLSIASAPAAHAAGQTLPSGQNMPLILRDRVMVGSEDVMLSDLFANLPSDADRRISSAPAPGERLVLSSRQLWQYAQAYGLNWRPDRTRISVVISRASLEVPMEAISDIISARLVAQFVEDDFDIDLFGRSSKIYVPADAPLDLQIHAFSYEPRTKRFDAAISAEGGRITQFTGKIVAMVEVPMLRRHAMPGQIITNEMVAWQRVSTRQASVTTVTRAEDIIGHEARRPLTAGVPIRLTDLKPNLLVKKGDLITLMVRTGIMTLTARGNALESGTHGAVIRVRNSHSDKIVEARIAGPDIAIIAPTGVTSLAALGG